MSKYLLVVLVLCLNIRYGHATDVDMLPIPKSAVSASQPTAAQICEGIITTTTLVKLPLDSISSERIRRWGEASVTASLYYGAVAGLESTNRAHDLNQAKAWYAKASLSGDSYALYSLAIILIEWENQEALGRILMQAAADKNYYDARVYLGLEKEDY